MHKRVMVLVLCVCGGGGGGLCVCCYNFSAHSAGLNAQNKVYTCTCEFSLGFSRFLIHGFSINPSIQKLWREKANMRMSMYLSRLVLASFECRACISRSLKPNTE